MCNTEQQARRKQMCLMCFSSLCSPLVAAAQHSDAKAGSLLQHLKVCLCKKKKQKTGQILGNGVNYYIVTRQLSRGNAWNSRPCVSGLVRRRRGVISNYHSDTMIWTSAARDGLQAGADEQPCWCGRRPPWAEFALLLWQSPLVVKWQKDGDSQSHEHILAHH